MRSLAADLKEDDKRQLEARRVQDAQALVKGESSPRGPEVISSALASAHLHIFPPPP